MNPYADSTPDAIAWLGPGAPERLEAKAVLKPILETGRLSRFRVLDVVCQRSHRLVQVIRTGVGLVVVGVGPLDYRRIYKSGGTTYHPDDPEGWGAPIEWEAELDYTERTSRAAPFCEFLDALTKDGLAILPQCRCRAALVPSAWLSSAIEAGHRRAVYD